MLLPGGWRRYIAEGAGLSRVLAQVTTSAALCCSRRAISAAAASTSAARSLTSHAETHSPSSKKIRRGVKNSDDVSSLRLRRRDRIRRRRQTRTQHVIEKTEALRASLAETTNARDVVVAQLADAIFSRGAEFKCTATNITYTPDGNPAMPEVAFVGRGQSGKSSLLRSLFRSSRAVSRANNQRRRQGMNFFAVGGNLLSLVELPGYGGTSVPWTTLLQHASVLRNYIRCRPNLKMLYYCLDAHYINGLYVQDIDMLQFLARECPNFTVVLTKADQLTGGSGRGAGSGRTASYVLRVQDVREELLRHDVHHPMLATSAYHLGGIDALRYDIVMNCVHSLPTERLTLTEVKRLSQRLLSQRELVSVRRVPLNLTPDPVLDGELREWNRQLQLEAAAASEPPHPPPAPAPVAAEEPGARDGALAPLPVGDAVATTGGDSEAYASAMKKLSNAALLQYVRETSPWRNPLAWPAHVVPTKHPQSNIMRHPDDPGNPYLYQPHFVAPRADFVFRHPNVGTRRGRSAGSGYKGRYEADKPLAAFLQRRYTIPYFPDIVDTNMHPQPWTFLGSRERYYERSGGRQLGLRLLHHATDGEIQPFSDTPVPSTRLEKAQLGRSTAPSELPPAAGGAALNQEVKRLEALRYGRIPIAKLKPPPPSAPSTASLTDCRDTTAGAPGRSEV